MKYAKNKSGSRAVCEKSSFWFPCPFLRVKNHRYRVPSCSSTAQLLLSTAPSLNGERIASDT